MKRLQIYVEINQKNFSDLWAWPHDPTDLDLRLNYPTSKWITPRLSTLTKVKIVRGVG